MADVFSEEAVGQSVALEKLRRAARRLPAADQTPDMDDLLAFLEAQRDAHSELQGLAGPLGSHQPGPGSLDAPVEEGALFKVLAHSLQGAVAGAAAVQMLHGPPRLLHHYGLHPAVALVNELAGPRAFAAVPVPPLAALQLLASAVAYYLTIGTPGMGSTGAMAVKLVSFAMEALWPDHPAARRARRLLERSHWVPAFPEPGAAAAAASEPAPPSPSARALQAALAHHCPGIALSDVRRWALVLRLFAAARDDTAPREQGKQQELLCDAQELLSDLGGLGLLPAKWSAALVFDSLGWAGMGSERCERLCTLVAEGLRRAIAAKRWYAASFLACQAASINILNARDIQSRIPAARQTFEQLMQAARGLLESAAGYDARMRPWLPGLLARVLALGRAEVIATLESLTAPARPGGTATPPDGPDARQAAEQDMRCAACGRVALHLRKCGACRVAACAHFSRTLRSSSALDGRLAGSSSAREPQAARIGRAAPPRPSPMALRRPTMHDSPRDHADKPRRSNGGSSGSGSRCRRCTAPAAALLCAALVALCWTWRASPQGLLFSGERLLAPTQQEAAAPTEQDDGEPWGSRLERPSRTAASLSAATVALFASDEPPLPVRPAALSRMAARLREGGLQQQQAAATEAAAEATGEAEESVGTVQQPAQQQQQQPQQQQQQQPRQERGFPASSNGTAANTCHPNLVVVLTSHKTGTAQAGCITELVEQRYIMQGASRHDHHPADLHAAARFAAQRLPTQLSGAGGHGRLYCPSVKSYSSGHHLPRLEDEACPGTLPCPCAGEQEQCLSLEPGTIDVPPGNTTVIQIIREPINVVLSAYQYHTQEPAPEEWLEQMTMLNFTGWLYAGGVPYEALDALGAHAEPHANLSFYSFLRQLPREQGIKLQFWMSAWELYGFARQYASLAAQPGFTFLPVRFEDLQERYNATAALMLEAMRERAPQIDVPAMLGEVQVCHISSWNSSLLASHDHVTGNRDPGLRKALRAVLMADPEIAARICELSAMFGYGPEPECARLARAAAAPSAAAAQAAAAAPGGSSVAGHGSRGGEGSGTAAVAAAASGLSSGGPGPAVTNVGGQSAEQVG